MIPEAREPRRPSLMQAVLELGPWLAPVLIALAPAVGFGARWGALFLAGVFGSSLRITAAEPFAVHAATGALYMLIAVTFFTTVLLADRYIPGFPRLRELWPRSTAVARVALIALLIILLLFLPAGLLLAPVFLVSGLLLRMGEEPSTPAWRRLVPIALVFSVATTICFAAIGSVPGVGVAQFVFRPKLQTANGRYIELARSGDALFLYPCHDTELGALVVPADSIIKQTYEQKPLVSGSPSLFAMVVWHRPFRLGLSHTCPPPP